MAMACPPIGCKNMGMGSRGSSRIDRNASGMSFQGPKAADDPGLKSEPAPANLIKMRAPVEVQSMDGSGTKTHGPIAQSELDKITRGSMVQGYDPETDVWYWVVIERRLKDPHWLQGRIDAHCVVLGPTLRHGGRGVFPRGQCPPLHLPSKGSPNV
jgi:hypothetical protein